MLHSVFAAAHIYNEADISNNEDLSREINKKPSNAVMVISRGSSYIPIEIRETPLGIATEVTQFTVEDKESEKPSRAHHSARKFLEEMEEKRAAESVLVATLPSIDGHHATKIFGILSAECVLGVNIINDLLSAVSDIFGGRNKSSQDALREAREICISELRSEALSIGANAVIGVKLDYSEISGQGKSMLFLVASGTAVLLEKTPSQAIPPQIS